jgi:hypothetical protein
MMRVGLALTLVIGAMLCISGIFAVFYAKAGAESLVLAGSGMMTTSSWAKAIQKKWECNDVKTN